MKTTRLIVGIGLMVLLAAPSSSWAQRLVFSTESGKNGIINVSYSPIKENKFDVNITVSWVNAELKPVNDRVSVIGFNPNRMEFNSPFIKFLPVGDDMSLVAFNNSVTLKFQVDERFAGGNIDIKFPFFYSTSLAAAAVPNQRQEFNFARPRNFIASTKVDASTLVDKTPPKINVLSPEGVADGLKPILESDKVRIELKVSDFFGVDKVMVNNVPAQHMGDSTYIIDLMLRYGFDNPIRVVAEDKSGHKSEVNFNIESRRPTVTQVATANPTPTPVPGSGVAPVKEREPSDVDIDIPVVGKPDPNRYALIIGNEDYSSYQRGLRTESDVEFAIHDAETFKKYALKVLGVPEDNILFYKNARVVEMNRAINQINTIAKIKEGKAEIFVYYAGHGFPDERSYEPYLMPVDVSGADLEMAIKLSYFYEKLTEFPTKRVTVFIDACFSGGGREQGLLAARAIKVRPKENLLKGNLVVFAAASGDQSALPWSDKNHGMFTYHVLKLLKETEGDITYGEMADYLRTSVGTRSVIVNQKEQNPQTNISPTIDKAWKEWRVR